ncbi:sigma-54-dependent Fis family transcriptional regulator [Sporomusa acidovorans]|uniref:Acetoin dehydrogenase operon transcriptional activator AcoR n=1 Tax=Sporomusa acidovorans (strain ATCC 49682 / DSM 3132 / Mol) TaxID=1123286 RepID=A0ABZ3J0T4_SPOA4|nr:sigma-54-dependent Fis family transcriptional regulator [Sporomusa acidovorans]OZC21316.1 acetoin dehydrogenase operon transcriptional activator AcoR [Sporomusa acidovorans DSM 3132]SDE57509.1 Transcriptional regulator of acetoin/glycerol metabolism [Sporomusa acidovorans]
MNIDYVSKLNNNNSPDKLQSAWLSFVEKGILLEQDLPSFVAKSWRRCRSLVDPGIDPNKVVLSGDALKIKRYEYQELIAKAASVMRDICTLGGHRYFVMLCDPNGYAIEVANNTGYPVPLGAKCREEDIGTNAIGIALAENRFVEIKSYEHYVVNLHKSSCAAMPIHDPAGKIIGAINVSNPAGALQPEIAKILKFTAQMIEYQLVMDQEKSRRREAENAFMSLKNIIEQYMLVIDNNGTIIDANQKCINLFKNNNRILTGTSMQDIIRLDKNDTEPFFSPGRQFKLLVDDGTKRCKVVKSKIYKDSHEAMRTLLFFESDEHNTGSLNTGGDRDFCFVDIVGEERNWSNIIAKAQKAAKFDSSVLLEGASGTGKELIARKIHLVSGRKGLFVPVNCGAIPKELIASELFGYEDGAFTGAKRSGMKGKFEQADGGTLFLDEIGEMPLDLQVHLLRFLQNKVVTRVGGTTSRQVNVRVIAATNRELCDSVKKGEFREDLYYRLNVINFHLPSLKERKDDIPLLVHHFIEKFCRQWKRPLPSVDPAAMESLCRYDWPGNVRELGNVIETAIVFSEDNILKPADFPVNIIEYVPIKPRKSGKLKKYQEEVILETLKKNGGNITKTAETLGIARNTLYNKIRSEKLKEQRKI